MHVQKLLSHVLKTTGILMTGWWVATNDVKDTFWLIFGIILLVFSWYILNYHYTTGREG